MKLYYAAGGGLGHLSRGWALAHMWNWRQQDVLFLYAPYPDYPYDWVLKKGPTPYDAIHIPFKTNVRSNKKQLQEWLIGFIQDYGITEIYLDCFPSGLIGEWKKFPLQELRFYLVARNLKAAAYGSLFANHPAFEKIYQVEAFMPDYQVKIDDMGGEVLPIDIQYPQVGDFDEIIEWIDLNPRPRWMIVHSGWDDELQALYDMAKDDARKEEVKPYIFLVNPHSDPFPEVPSYQFFPAYPIFPYVDRLYSGAGFNTMKQAEGFEGVHRVLPFVRRYDDQFWRKQVSMRR